MTLKDQLASIGLVIVADRFSLDAGIASHLTNAAPVSTSAAQSGAVTEWVTAA